MPFDKCLSSLPGCLNRLLRFSRGCQLHYHTADSVLTGGCSFIRQQIWIKIWIMLAILCNCIDITKFSSGKSCMWIGISSQQIDDFETLSTGSVTCWGWWCSGQSWRQQWSRLWSRLWSQLSASVGPRCTCSPATLACVWMFCGAILPRKASGRVVSTKHSRVSFYRSLHHFTPKDLHTLHHFSSDHSVRFLDRLLRFLHCGARKAFFGHFGHFQGQAHVGLFQLYTTSLPRHHSRYVEHFQEISCRFKHWDLAITSTICASVAFSKVIEASFVNSWGCFSGNSSAKILELTSS